MLNKYKIQDTSDMPMTMSTSKTVTVTNSFSKTTSTSTTGSYARTIEYRSSFSGTPSSTYRSAFNNQPIASYRSFNTKAAIEPKKVEEVPKKTSRSLMSLIFKKDKEDQDKDSKKKEQMKEKETKDEKTKDKDKPKSNKSKEEKTKDVKQQNSAPTYDARPILPPVRYNYPVSNNRPTINIGNLDRRLVIKVTKTRKIHGVDNDKIPTYLTNSKYKRGRVLLINNINFANNKYRDGAQIDHNNIISLFKQMGFTVNDHKNKSKKDMEKTVTDYCKDSSLRGVDINVTIIMSHGNGNQGDTYIETIDNDVVSIEWIVNQFSNFTCSYLANKPKIFIFQCCRGAAFDTVQIDATPFQPPRNQADVLLAYATVPGFVSHRDPKLGTWYIQAICKIFMEHAHDTDVENLLKIVDDNLAKTNHVHRQTSSYENRGFKRCYLNPI